MPCATIHLLLADRVLEDWRATPGEAPVELDRPEIQAAFLHGCLAPDMGFLPGADRFVSELAHYVRPAALTHALGSLASNAIEAAFAWGWATHVLGDIEIHPIVGRAVGDRLYGDRDRRVDAEEDVATHVAVEVGLDVHFLTANPRVSKPPAGPHFNAGRIKTFAQALEQTYGVTWAEMELLDLHRRAVRMSRYWPPALRALRLAGRVDDRKSGSWSVRWLAGWPLAALTALTAKGTPVHGFLNAVRPPRWMIEEVAVVIERFPKIMREVARNGFEDLPDRNLETGGPAGSGLGHSASDAAAGKLEALRRTVLSADPRIDAADR